MSDSLKIATALETLVEKAITDFERGLHILRIPQSVRAPMWEAISRRVIAKVIECERKAKNDPLR